MKSARYGVLFPLVGASFLVVLNETVTINAMPKLMDEFGLPASAAQWVTTSFILTLAVVIPTVGWFLERVSVKDAYLSAMSVFCLGTAIATAAPEFWVLVAARVVQAMGTAVMMPLLMTTLLTIVDERDRGKVIGNVSLVNGVAPALGPAVSGVMLEFTSWRWMFAAVLPVAVVATVVGARRLSDISHREPRPLDPTSVFLIVIGFAPLVLGLSALAHHGSLLAPIALLGVGVTGIAMFSIRQVHLNRTGRALLNPEPLKHRTYLLALGVLSAGYLALIGTITLLPLYLQDVRGLSVFWTGLLLVPGGLLMASLNPVVGRLLDRYGGRRLYMPGACGFLLALCALTRVDETTSYGWVLAAHMLLLGSLAALFTPTFTLGMGALPVALYGHGASIIGTVQQVTAAISATAAISILSVRSAALVDGGADSKQALLGGLQWAFAFGALAAIAVVAVATALPNRSPKPAGVELRRVASQLGPLGDPCAIPESCISGHAAERPTRPSEIVAPP